ncbi:MAG: PepSY domain-containing protein [Paracoccus sp. (in: a-proteobacteria)]|uniref:PepSY domain-containing protein n=1 Tax=Paracoccus sp. TaxID=267 RepID=UPI002E8BE23D|nr:hypothetical protein [Pseudomonadota bacterium]
MIRPFHLAILLMLAMPPAALAQAVDPWQGTFRPLPLHQLAERVNDRYQGRLLAAEARPARPQERSLGAEMVYQFRLLTPARHVLDIRLDARDGRFLDVAGRGQTAARRTLRD